MRWTLPLILVNACLLAGCASITSRTPERYQHNAFYSGSQQDSQCFFDSALCAIDLPLSVVGDTLMLPFDGWYYYQTPEEMSEEKE